MAHIPASCILLVRFYYAFTPDCRPVALFLFKSFSDNQDIFRAAYGDAMCGLFSGLDGHRADYKDPLQI